jgi:diguanylate cyclase (GGDEF)-like protein
MDRLIDHLADFCSLRDREALDTALLALVEQTAPDQIRAVRLVLALTDADGARKHIKAERNAGVISAAPGPLSSCVVAVEASAMDKRTLEVDSTHPLTDMQRKDINALLRIYKSMEGLLDYGERDTLTELLNRKTFDGAFLKASAEHIKALGVDQVDRRHDHVQAGYWLAVLDIDHFKRVNDNFGHLIGDEVLLLLARLMRDNFRFHDQLYRFGGEEFVVLMRCASQQDAFGALERLRLTVQNHEFPQVGSITVSIGFASLQTDDTPSSAFDRADKAVYHVKGHGRNQVCSYEELVAAGELVADDVESREADFF